MYILDPLCIFKGWITENPKEFQTCALTSCFWTKDVCHLRKRTVQRNNWKVRITMTFLPMRLCKLLNKMFEWFMYYIKCHFNIKIWMYWLLCTTLNKSRWIPNSQGLFFIYFTVIFISFSKKPLKYVVSRYVIFKIVMQKNT